MPQRSSPLRAHSIAGALLAGESSRTEIRTRSPKWYTKRPHALVDAQATRGMLHEMASLRRQHIPVRWCRRRALLPFHGPVQSVPVGDVDQRAAATERRQGRDLVSLPRGPKQHAQRRLDQFGHGAPLAAASRLSWATTVSSMAIHIMGMGCDGHRR